MGLVLDSSALVAAERQALPVSTLLERLQRQHYVTEIAIGVVELEHGIYRAQSPQQASKRRAYWTRLSRPSPPNRLPARSAKSLHRSMPKLG